MRKFLSGILAVFILTGCVQTNEQVVLKSISFTPDTVTFTAGNAIQLSPIFMPSTFSKIGVNWVSANPDVVSVSSDGMMYAKKTGSAWVTVKDKNSATSGKVFVIITP